MSTPSSPEHSEPEPPPTGPAGPSLAARAALLSGLLVFPACQPQPLTEKTRELATGVYHHTLHLTEGPWSIHVIELDLRKAWKAGIRLRTARPVADEAGLARTSSMAGGAIAAINGGFFYDDSPSGLQISRGRLVAAPRGQSAFAISAEGAPMVAVFNIRTGLITPSGKQLPISLFNRSPGNGGLSCLNRFAAARIDSVRADIGFELQSLGERSVINDTVRARVLQVRRRGWPLKIADGQWLVAGSMDLPEGEIVAGDTVGLFCLLPPAVSRLEEAIGGGPRIVRDGYPSIEYEREKLGRGFTEERHPRTAVGHSQDGRTLFLVTIDGRQPGYSVGMSLAELADFMADDIESFSASGANAYHALNLDGGGSTTMVVGNQVVNRPSDQTGEREVANALLVVAQGPEEEAAGGSMKSGSALSSL